MKVVYLLLGMAFAGFAGCGSSSPPRVVEATPAASGPDAGPVAEQSFAQALNAVRRDSGAAPVRSDPRLVRAARAHATDMQRKGYFSHSGADGSSVADRVTRAGYPWRAVAENIAMGQQSEAEVLAGWVRSPGHQANNINPRYTDFGLAKAGSGNGTYWVLVFGRQR